MNLSDTAALVTGGGSGLGAATALALAQAGAKVAVLDRNEDAAHNVAARIGASALALACDVTDPHGAERAIQAAADAQGPARILVNCAGIGTAGRVVGREGPLPLEEFERVIRVNLIGTFNMIRLAAHAMAALPPLEDGERGVIVNTASIAAFDGQIGQAAYAASKGAVASMTLPIARELARAGVRVMTIAPGLFLTPMLKGLPEEVQQSLGAAVPYPPRLGDPAEYADLALHIVRNRMLNGETIRLDGALRMAPK